MKKIPKEVTLKIAIDLRVLQIGHQYRGIGAHLISLLQNFNHLEGAQKQEFFFYINRNQENPIRALGLDLSKLNYEIIEVMRPEPGGSWKRKLQKGFIKFYNLIIKRNIGLPRLREMDVFLQLDFMLGVPSSLLVKSVLVAYDLIPWVMDEYYIPNYRQSRKRGSSKKAAVKALANRIIYKFMIRSSVKRSSKILAISDYTRKDFVRILRIRPNKIETILLAGLDEGKLNENRKTSSVTGLSYDFFGDAHKEIINLDRERFVFWLGGADRRRRLEDLVEAFNLLNSRGIKLKLLLAGFDFKSLEGIVTDDISREAIKNSSYRRNIVFLGHVNEDEKKNLYRFGVACVLPSTYEGFGLTILESMYFNCPVITYRNTSISEVGGDAVIYARDPVEIDHAVQSLINDSTLRKKIAKKANKQLLKFSWEDTAKKTLASIINAR